ncbi:putative clathrin assembly protein [Ananas comosus]|uniref:Putative clathrin assembly protein n=1 Tax=Ananas comosus TaxID=4615 RepID=A0A199W8T0_ANACO|nr:putative clathrin assembly protein [Ananas comosus]
MGLKLRGLVGALKDTASFGKAALLSPPAAPSAAAAAASLAVLRATPHHPWSSPPPARHLEALLSFGRGSRLAAAALVGALAARLRSTRDPAVALKALLSLHLLLSRGAFILRDQLPPLLLRHPSSGHNPLALSSFPLGSSPSSWALAAWVRWFARLLELLLLLPPAPSDPDRLASLLNPDLVAELEPLVAVAEEIRRAPAPTSSSSSSSSPLHNMLIRETIRVAEEDRIAAEREIGARVRELRERVDSLGFADSVELACLLKRLEGGADRKGTVADDPFWGAVAELRERVEGAVAAKGEQERRVRRRERPMSESARISGRVESALGAGPVRFGSARWLQR